MLNELSFLNDNHFFKERKCQLLTNIDVLFGMLQSKKTIHDIMYYV